MNSEIWILHKDKTVLLQDEGLGVPASAITSSDGTIGGTYYDPATLLGPFPMPDTWGWGEGYDVARAKAEELGYEIDYNTMSVPWTDDDDPEAWEQE